MPTARGYLAAVTGGDGRIYAIGGTDGDKPLTKVEAYDPKTDSWTVVAPMQKPRYGHAAALGPDGRIYVVGGQYEDTAIPGDVSKDVESYDVVANTWRSEPALGRGRYEGAVVTAGGRLYAIGGFDHATNQLTDPLESIAPGEASWTVSTFAMNTPRSSHGVALLADGRILALGGTADGAKLNEAEIYDPTHPGWSTTAPLYIPRMGVSAVSSKGSVYALGGNCFNTGCTDTIAPDVELYDAAGKQWGVAAPMLTARYYLGVSSDANGHIYAVGGIFDSNFLASQSNALEIFTP
jgi:kelch-like protein 18